MKRGDEREHPSYGTIIWGRVQGGHRSMFMSSLKHDHRIEITIAQARMSGDGYRTRVSGAAMPEIVRVEMTEAQFAHFLSTPGRMPGVPCTIVRRGGKAVEDCPDDERLVEFRNNLDDDATAVVATADSILQQANEMLQGKSVRKKDLRNLCTRIEGLRMAVSSNMPYLLTEFNRYMDTVFQDAVARFEGHVHDRLEQMGLETLQTRGMAQLSSEDEKG